MRNARGSRLRRSLTQDFCAGHATSSARGLVPPHGVSDKQKLYVEVELLDFQPAKARACRTADMPSACAHLLLPLQVVTDVGGLVTKRILHEGTGLETPHAPYEARRHVVAPYLHAVC